VSTASAGGGFGGISVSFNHRASGTNSRWAQVDYTLDGGTTWVTGFWNNNGGLSPHDTFYTFTVDFSSVSGANNNAGFGFRIVSIFSPQAFNQNSTLSYGANAAYMRANADAKFAPTAGVGTSDYGTGGTWRFDNVTVNGTAIPAPGAIALLGAAGLVGARRRRN
jgi:MYXO-CTERM domain-containing protein